GDRYFGMFGRLVLGAGVVCGAEIRLEERDARPIFYVHDLTGTIALSARRRPEGDNADNARLGEELGYLRNSAHILFAIRSRHAKIGGESVPDVVAAEHEHLDVTFE